MTITRTTSLQIIAPLALAGALLFTGCSVSSTPIADTVAAIEESELIIGTGITSMDDVRYGVIDSDDATFNAAVEELVLALNAASPGGLSEININCHSPQRVEVNLLTDSTDGTITDAQVTATVDTIAMWASQAEVGEILIGGFNINFGAGEILTGAAEAGVNADFLDEMYGKIAIPGDQLDSIYA